MNPLKADPTRTTTLRKNFVGRFASSFRKVKGAVRRGTLNAGMIENKLMEAVGRVNTDSMVRKAYDNGRRMTYYGVRGTPNVVTDVSYREFLRLNPPASLGALQQKVNAEKQRLVRSTMDQIERIIEDAQISGISDAKLKKQINDRIDKAITRSKTLVNTEVIRTNAEAALDTMEGLGIQKLRVNVEWTTRQDGRVCPRCQPLANVVMTPKKARGLFPVHPNCRCMPVPIKQNVNQSQLRKALRRSNKAV